MSWTIDLSTCEARHTSGLVLRFELRSDGGWDGEVVAGVESIDPADAPRLMREAGDAYREALKNRQ